MRSRAGDVAAASGFIGIPGQTFNFYISPTGSDSNPGTLTLPWAVTAVNTKRATYAGQRVGFLPGNYDVSGLMGTNEAVAALTIAGGTSSANQTYFGSSDASGFYLRGTATLDAKGASGLFGGGNANASPIMAARSGTNFWTIDGLRFTGFSMWAFHVGDSPSGGNGPTNWTIQFCEFTGGSAQNNTVSNGVNLGPIINYSGSSGLVTQNYFHDNLGWTDPLHFSCIYQWGLGNSATVGNIYSFNTVVNSSNFQGKEATQYNTEIAYNYFDMTLCASGTDVTAAPIFGFMADNGLGTLSKFHHNVMLHQGMGIVLYNTNIASTYVRTPAHVYNNTFVAVSEHAAGMLIGGYVNTGSGGTTHNVSSWNNLFWDNGIAANAYGYVMTGIDLFALSDFNMYGGWNLWGSVPDSSSGSTPLTAYHTLAAFRTGFGTDANSLTNTANPFTNGGTFADQFHVLSGSPAFNAGRIGGLITGAQCNMGAWDGTGRPGATWVS